MITIVIGGIAYSFDDEFALASMLDEHASSTSETDRDEGVYHD